MTLEYEAITFLIFIATGILFSIIFDIFRAIRKVKKVNNRVIYIQDIIYFFIIGIILIVLLINYMDSEFRIHLIFAIILGIIIYISVIGNFVLNIFVKFFKMTKSIMNFIFLPIILFRQIFDKQINILMKNVINCCKKISDMINLKCIKKKCVKLKTKEDYINDKSGKQSC